MPVDGVNPHRPSACRSASCWSTCCACSGQSSRRAGKPETDVEGIRPAHLQVFGVIKANGSRLTDLADSAGLSLSSMAELVDDLEALGYVQRQPDPSDRRAKLVGLTPSGWRAIRTGRAIIEQIEHDWGATSVTSVSRPCAAPCRTSSTNSTKRSDATTSRPPTNETGCAVHRAMHWKRRPDLSGAFGQTDEPIPRSTSLAAAQ